MEENGRGNKKRKAIDERPTINITVKSQDNDELYFKARREAPLLRLMRCYCDRKQFEYGHIRFFYDGKYIRPNQTPDSLDLEDGAVIDAMFQQSGGGRRSL